MTPFTDEDLMRLKECVHPVTGLKVGFFNPPRTTMISFDIETLIARLEAAEKVCDEAVSVAYNTATTAGTVTNSKMPKWFLRRIKEMDLSLQTWLKSKGEL